MQLRTRTATHRTRAQAHRTCARRERSATPARAKLDAFALESTRSHPPRTRAVSAAAGDDRGKESVLAARRGEIKTREGVRSRTEKSGVISRCGSRGTCRSPAGLSQAHERERRKTWAGEPGQGDGSIRSAKGFACKTHTDSRQSLKND
eukprot:6207199-Pleurochrysis_carterae.AAC.2